MTQDAPQFDSAQLDAMNSKTIENALFTPDHSYIELSLFKDFKIGALYAQHILNDDETGYHKTQATVLNMLSAYENRYFDTIDPYFAETGFNQADVDRILSDTSIHDKIFMVSPNTHFFELLIRHTLRNQNNSKPGHKYTKKKLDKDHYTLESIPVVYHINTYPLTLSVPLMETVGQELGELLGVDVVFMCKDPATFDKTDWDTWLEKIDCYYLDSLGRFVKSPFIFDKQHHMEFIGCFMFVRKCFEPHKEQETKGEDLEALIDVTTAHMKIFCDFEWIKRDDLSLSEKPVDVPMTEEENTTSLT